MATGDGSSEPEDDDAPQIRHEGPPTESGPKQVKEESDEDEEEDEEEDEPRLKYATLTKSLSNLYRNGDATSAVLVGGDKMIIGTHNGNIHVLSLPALNSIKAYRAHSASVSAISISPYPPPLPTLRPEALQNISAQSAGERGASPSNSPAGKKTSQQPAVPSIPSNQIYIATSSIDGNVCVSSLVDSRDVQLRNFGRPIQSVALSPKYRSDRTFLSGGQAGNLIRTIGGQSGTSTNATTTGAAAAASSWLGSIGLGANTGTDKILHSGEGIISTIKWSFSGKYVLWVNEQGIKIMRSHLHLDSNQSHLEWKRIAHIDRPSRPGWEDMAGVWKARAEWVDRDNLEKDETDNTDQALSSSANTNGQKVIKSSLDKPKSEEVIVGWGDTVWIIQVFPSNNNSIKDINDHKAGRAEVVTIIRFNDCIISGVSLYTPNLLLVLAYMEKKGSSTPTESSDGSKKKRRQRHNALEPELRLIDVNTKEEVDTDTLSISRFETLSSSDYHLAMLPPVRVPTALTSKGYLGAIGSGIGNVSSGLYTGVETVGQGFLDAAMYAPRKLGANRILSGSESIRSSNTGLENTAAGSMKERNYLTGWIPGFGSSVSQQVEESGNMTTLQSMKIFIYSPYDCIISVKRTLEDRLQWLTNMQKYEQAWELIDQRPEAAGLGTSESSESSIPQSPSKASSVARSGTITSQTATQTRQQATLAEFFADSTSISSSNIGKDKGKFSIAEKEKRRIGELWLKQLVDEKAWKEAGEVAGKVLNLTTRWEHWIWIFIKNKKFDEISPFVPTLDLTPPLPSSIFEIILGHYVSIDTNRFKELLDQWPSDLFEISSITTAIEEQLKFDVTKGSNDWRILQECLAKLFLADGHYDDALRCYIQVQDADTAMSLIKEHHLVSAVADDIPSFVLLRTSSEQAKSASKEELEDLASEPIRLLVDETSHGAVNPDEVVRQLQSAKLDLFLYFYFRGLWKGEGLDQAPSLPRVGHSAAASNLIADTGKVIVDDFADLAVELFADHDRGLLMEFLHTSTGYTFEHAVKICEKRHYNNELVYLLSKTGQMKKALFLIIDELKDVSKAIAFAKEQDDKDLWDDLLDYSMSRPRFISGLLAEVGTSIDPITLVKRIPSGLEIQGLKDGLKKMIREYDLQDSISSGVAKVLSSEVAVGMHQLRRGRRKGIKFDVATRGLSQPILNIPGAVPESEANHRDNNEPDVGHCEACHKAFNQNEKETLVGFACGHAFHLSHLLRGPDYEGEVDVSLPSQATRGDNDDDEPSSPTFQRTVGPKVTNARLLKDKIAAVGGCSVCKVERMKAEEVS